jgi:hypothetical protein
MSFTEPSFPFAGFRFTCYMICSLGELSPPRLMPQPNPLLRLIPNRIHVCDPTGDICGYIRLNQPDVLGDCSENSSCLNKGCTPEVYMCRL